MQNIETILQQLDGDCELSVVRNAMVELIVYHLQAKGESLSHSEKLHFTNAIGSLALNVDALRQPTTAWLRLCLSDLGQVLASTERRDQAQAGQDKLAESVTYEELMEAIESIRKKCPP